MAQNETSVSGDVVWQDGDDLSETNLTRTAAKSNLTDYVERGLGFAADFSADTLDIGSGHVIIQSGAEAYDVFPDQQTGISLPNSSGINYVYVAIQPGTDDDVFYHVDDDDTAPTEPALKIGTVDTSADTADDTINRDPDASFGDTTHDSVSTEKADTRNGYTELSDSRSFDTWYQNTTGADLDVEVSANASVDGTRIQLTPHVNDSQSDNSITRADDTVNSFENVHVGFVVPNGYYYKIDSRLDTADYSVDFWSEQS